MAINTDFNINVSQQLLQIYNNAETVMLERLKKRVDRNITNTGWTERKAQEITYFRNEVEEYTESLNKVTKREMSEALKNSYEKGIRSAESDFKLLPSIFDDLVVPARLQRLILEANGIVERSNLKVLRSTVDVFQQIQAEVATGVLTGVETRKEIAQRMLNRLADKGITGFTDKLGRNWDISSYVETATRTVTARAAVQGHIDRQTQSGRDLVIVSSHGGCPICRPWEGKILSISGAPPHTSLETAIAAGLFHPNCKHTLTGYVEGLTVIEDPPNRMKPEQYEYTQVMRSNERQIRRWKRRLVVAEGSQGALKAKNKILYYQSKQRSLITDYEAQFGMTLRRKYDREGISNKIKKDNLPKWLRG